VREESDSEKDNESLRQKIKDLRRFASSYFGKNSRILVIKC